MKRYFRFGFGSALAISAAAALALACSDDPAADPFDINGPNVDGGTIFSDAGAGSPSLYLSYTKFGAATATELGAFDPKTAAIRGLHSYAGSGSLSKTGSNVFALEQDNQRVVRLGTNAEVVGAWNVGKAVDGGQDGNPVQVVMVSPTKAYVVLYNTSRVVAIDPSETGVAGTPKKTIDLLNLAQAADGDQRVEPSGAAYDPATKRLYVVLGNIDNTKIPANGAYYECSEVKSSLIAIDTETDAIVSLGGAAPGGGVFLQSHNPVNSIRTLFDTAGSRLLVVGAGCTRFPPTDGGDAGMGSGTIERRGIEEVTLPSLTTRMLVNVTDPFLFPSSLALLSPTEAVVGFYGAAYRYNPTTRVLGAPIVGAPDVFALDGRELVGTRVELYADGGKGPLELVRLSLDDDAGATVLAQQPFSSGAGGSVLAVELSP